MKKIIFILLLIVIIFLFSGCGLQKLVRPIEPDQSIPEGMVAVVGKISLYPEPEQELRGLSFGSLEDAYGGKSAAYLRKGFVDKIKNIIDSDWAVYSEWDKYFVVIIPREDIYLITVEVVLKTSGSGDTIMYLHSPLLIDFEEDDEFVYIGNLEYYFGVKNELGGRDNILKLVDNYEEAIIKYDGYVIGSNGESLHLEKRILKGDVELDVEVIESKIVYY